jgi:Rho termination factor, N-terminal domain
MLGIPAVTASGKAQLKSMPLGKLKKYANAYNIRTSHAVEKDDVIEALLSARVGTIVLVAVPDD